MRFTLGYLMKLERSICWMYLSMGNIHWSLGGRIKNESVRSELIIKKEIRHQFSGRWVHWMRKVLTTRWETCTNILPERWCVLRELIRLQFRKDSHRGLDKTLPPWRDKVTKVCIRGNQGESRGIKIYYQSDQKTRQKSWLSVACGRDTRKISKVGPQAP